MTDRDEKTQEHGRLDMVPLTGCRIVVTAGPAEDVGRTVDLPVGTALIGRSSTCDLPLSDMRASRRHATLTIERDGVVLRDLESRNGTMFLGSRIERARVPHGATITIGATTIAILPLEAATQAPALTTSYAELAGESVAMRQLFTTLQKLESTDVNVHLYGEAGTGKELVARVIHKKSKRSSGPFIAVDCGALTDEAVTVELFGRIGRGPGALEQADGGTIYIEEFDAMPMSTQMRLKQVLERGETRRLDDSVRRKVNVRVIASAQRNLQEAVADEVLRPELFHQVAVVTAKIPPLRERPEDIPHIANTIASRAPSPRKLTDHEQQQLASRPWPGNVRELRAVVLRTLALGAAGLAQPSGAPVHDRTVSIHDPTYKEARERIVMAFEAQFINNLMQKHNGNVSAAAREAKISRKHLHELLRRHRIS